MAAVVTTRAGLEQAASRKYNLPSPASMQPTCGVGGVRPPIQSPPRERGRKRPLCPSSTSSAKLEKCRTQAQQRRMTQKGLMDELAGLLPFPKEVTSQMDTKTVLRLAVCYLRVKSLLAEEGSSPSSSTSESSTPLTSVGGWPLVSMETSTYQPHPMLTWNQAQVGNGMGSWMSNSLVAGTFKDLMVEALQGFLMVASCDGTILYLSESVFNHTGLFQSEHTGKSMYTLIHEEDHSEVREALTSAEAAALSSGAAPCSFFCRLKSKKKNSHLKAPGYKLAYVSGHCKVHQLEPYVACMVHIVSAPSILEIRVEGNTFTTRHDLNMKIIFYDEKMKDILGYSKKDMMGHSLFTLHHHDDLEVTEKCSRKVREKGEAVTGYYRILTRYGTYVWLQSRGTMVMDRRTGKPSQLLCMHFLVSKEKGDHSLKLRNLLTEDSSSSQSIAMDPLPVPRPDGKPVNPLSLPETDTPRTLSSSPDLTLTPEPSIVTPPSLSPPSSSPPCPLDSAHGHTHMSPPRGGLTLPSDSAHGHTHMSPPRGGLTLPSDSAHGHTHMSPPRGGLTLPSDSAHGHTHMSPPRGGSTVWSSQPPPPPPPPVSEEKATGVNHHRVSPAPFTISSLGTVQSATPPLMNISDRFPCSQSSKLPFPGSQTPVPPFPACPQSIQLGPCQGQLHPLSRSTSPASTARDPSSAVPTPFSTSVPSPDWSEETSPSSLSGPYSNPNSIASSNPYSIPNSNVTSPQPIPGHPPASVETNSDPSSLEAILQDLLGDTTQGSSSSSLPPQEVIPSSSVAISVSPDSGYTELEGCVNGYHYSPHSSVGTTPAHSPAAGGYYSGHSAAPSPHYPSTVSPPGWVGPSLPVNPFFAKASSSVISSSPPQFHTLPSSATNTSSYQFPPTTTVATNSGTLRGLLAASSNLQGPLLS